MQGAGKGEACDIPGAKRERPLTIAAAQQIQLRAVCRGGILSQNESITKQHTKGFGSRPDPLSQKR
jgi:hypothetical protein